MHGLRTDRDKVKNSVFSISTIEDQKDTIVEKIQNMYGCLQEFRDNEGFNIFSKK